MDTAAGASEGNPEESETGRSPSIGVPSIPAQAESPRPPAPVPSMPGLPEDADADADADPGVVSPAPTTEGPPHRAGSGPAGSRRAAPGALPGATPRAAERVDRSGPSAAIGQPGRTTEHQGDHPPPRPSAAGGDLPAGSEPFGMAFPPGVAGKLGWYVYLLSEPDADLPFLVGRGRGDRCFQHVLAARTRSDEAVTGAGTKSGGGAERGNATGSGEGADDPRQALPRKPPPRRAPREFPELERIRAVEAARGPVRVEILRYGLSADEARQVAAATAEVLGLRPDPKPGGQRLAAADLGIRLARRAKFKQDHPVVLLQVGGPRADLSYENVRHGWRIGRRWTDPHASRSPKWAVIVAEEMVVGVYRIEGWEPTPLEGRPGWTSSEETGRQAGTAGTAGTAGSQGSTVVARSTYRHSFIGERDRELEERYVGRSAVPYLGASSPLSAAGAAVAIGAPNQVAYVWCGPHRTKPGG